MHHFWQQYSLPTIQRESHFGDRVVACFAERPSSVYGMFSDAVARYPDREALVVESRRWTYRSLAAWVDTATASLAERGLQAGDRVVLFISNRAEFVLAFLAIQKLGAICVPVSIREQASGLDYVIEQCEASLLLHDADLAARVSSATQGIAWSVEAWVESMALASSELKAPPSFQTALPEDTAVILYTSGTTGRPKGAMLTHFNIVHSVLHFIYCSQWTAHSRSIMAVPASHVTGLIANIATAIGAGACTIIMPTFKASAYLALAQKERLTHTILVPAMYNLCLLDPHFESYDLSSWEAGGFGGAPMPVSTIDALAKKLPKLKLQNCYGATETTSPTTMMLPQYTRDHVDSVGVALPCAEIRVMDDAGCEVASGETGEIWIAGPMVVKGYWNNPEATVKEFTAGFWHSGDLGSVDAQGFVRVFDRKKDMLNRGGFKIYSVEVENHLMGLPGVVEAAVVGKPCPVLGERVHAYIHTGSAAWNDSLNAERLRAFCAQHLADYKVPESFNLSAQPLPRNANGKLMKRVLREQVLEPKA